MVNIPIDRLADELEQEIEQETEGKCFVRRLALGSVNLVRHL